MDLKDLPEPVRGIMRAAYGDATAQIFLISAIIGVVAFVAIMFIKERPLRRTVDIQPDRPANSAGDVTANTLPLGPATASGAAADGGAEQQCG
ncbi:drug resistance transporter, EmrB/QacA protein, partial [Arthrobacter sp. Hiyo6]